MHITKTQRTQHKITKTFKQTKHLHIQTLPKHNSRTNPKHNKTNKQTKNPVNKNQRNTTHNKQTNQIKQNRNKHHNIANKNT